MAKPIKFKRGDAGTLPGARARLQSSPALRLRAIQARRGNKGPGGVSAQRNPMKAAARLNRREILAKAEMGKQKMFAR